MLGLLLIDGSCRHMRPAATSIVEEKASDLVGKCVTRMMKAQVLVAAHLLDQPAKVRSELHIIQSIERSHRVAEERHLVVATADAMPQRHESRDDRLLVVSELEQ